MVSNLFTQHNEPLVVEIGENRRTVAEIFPAANGVVFFDAGWTMNDSGHPIHVIEGKITGSGPWRVGEARIRLMTEDDPQDWWQEWRDWREAIKRDYPPRERIEEIARRFGAIV